MAGILAGCMCVSVGITTPVRADRKVAEPSPLERAGKLIGQGQEKYDTADYIGAIELWSEAYAALPSDSEADQYRGVLVYQIANACREAYSVNREVRFLRKAEKLFQDYIKGLPSDDSDSRAPAEEALEEVRAQLADYDASEAANNPTPEDDPMPEDGDDSSPEDPDPLPPLGNGLRISGGISLGLGAVGLGLMGGFLGRGAALDSEGAELVGQSGPQGDDVGNLLAKGQAANRIAISMGIVGGLLTVAGVSLLVVDAVKRKRRAVAMTPMLTPKFAGFQLSGRF